MADGAHGRDAISATVGSGGSEPHGSEPPEGPIKRFSAWLVQTRTGMLAVWVGIGFIATFAALIVHAFGPFAGYLARPLAQSVFVAAMSTLVLPLLLMLLDRKDNFQHGPKRTLPTLTLGLLACVTAVALMDHLWWGHQLLGYDQSEPSSEQLANRWALFAFATVSFVPNIWNAANFARFEAERRADMAKDREAPEIEYDDSGEAIGALVGTIVVALIGALAVFAGNLSGQDDVQFENVYGMVLSGIVLGVFAVVVFLDTISESPPVQALSRMLRWLSKRTSFLANFYNWIDSGLVRIGSFVCGMAQDRTRDRYVLLAGTLSCLCLLAWFLPAPAGLIPASLAFILAISVSRLWAWVEDDRALAAMTDYNDFAPYRVGFREDFRDETLLGFMFIFLLVPISMMQAHEGAFFGNNLFTGVDERKFGDWFGFFGIELAKAVPIVDWAEIYNINASSDGIRFDSAASRHSVFLARVMVDMVLIASLLQAIGISSRNRQQKKLFNAKLVFRLDEFVERTELARAVRVTRRPSRGPVTADKSGALAAQHFNLSKLGKNGVVDFRRYDKDRLFRIYSSAKKKWAVRAFIAAIAHEGQFDLQHAIEVVRSIAERDKHEPSMYAAFERAKIEHNDQIHEITSDDIYLILQELRHTSGLRDFKYELIDMMARLNQPGEALERLTGLAGGRAADRFQYTRNHIARLVAGIAAEVSEAGIITDALATWESWPHGARPTENEYRAALTALRGARAKFD